MKREGTGRSAKWYYPVKVWGGADQIMERAEKLKQEAQEQIAAHRGELTELSLRIHDNPELSLEEENASRWLAEYLAGKGFEVTKPAYGLPTAFEAVYGEGSPSIGIIAEYDALPGIGHACGHNVIATAAVGAGLAAKKAAEEYGATIRVIGTPGEEGRGGKIRMAQNGAFGNVDAAMMVHPGDYNTSGCEAMAVAILSVEFHGKASHAAGAPQQGINALEAMIISYNAINSLRQHVVDGSRVHGIITDGGQAANVVPAHSAGLFYIRAKDDDYVEVLKERVVGCFHAGAQATGAQLEYRWSEPQYSTMKNSGVISGLYSRNLESLGRKVEPYAGKNFGSTDMGNVSYMVPGIHPIIAVAPRGVSIHTEEFEVHAGSGAGHRAMVDGATAMAWTVIDLLSEPSNLAQAKEEFAGGGR